MASMVGKVSVMSRMVGNGDDEQEEEEKRAHGGENEV